MFYIAIAVVSLLVHTFLIVSANVQVFPELYFLPWLVQKGLVPYRDFFDHHGFLLYYFLAPLIQDTSFYWLKLFTYVIESVNLVLLLYILRRTTSKIGYGIGAFLAVLVGFFMAENTLWYDLVITTIYLLCYLFLILPLFKLKSVLLGVLISFASMIKPNAAFVLLPTAILIRDRRLIGAFLLSWMVIFTLFLLRGALISFLYVVGGFNIYLAQTYHPIIFSEPKLFIVSFVLVVLVVFLFVREKKRHPAALTLLFFVSSFVFFSAGISRPHFVPVMTFFVLLVAQALQVKPSVYKQLFLAILLFFCFQATYEVVKHPTYLNKNRIPWQEDSRILPMIEDIKSLQPVYGTVYAYTNHSEIYIAIDQLPPTYFPYTYPLIEKYIPDYEKRIIKDLQVHNVGIVAIYKHDTLALGYTPWIILRSYIQSQYVLQSETDDYQLFVRASLKR